MFKLVAAAGYGSNRIRIDPSVVRGLEYYTGPVYECELLFPVTNEKGETVQFGSVAGGGRYDGLVERFTGQKVPATGFSIGVSRLATALKNLGKLGADTVPAPVVVCIMDRDAESLGRYQKMVQRLRDAGIRAELYQGNPKNFGNQLKYADRRGCPLAIIQGADERERGEVQIKDLALGARMSQTIDSREEWTEARAAQFTVAGNRSGRCRAQGAGGRLTAMAGKSSLERAGLDALNRCILPGFAAAGYDHIEPDILQPADIFLDRSGEDIRSRTYVFTDPAGHELCLRPDLTVPACRYHLSHAGDPSAETRYCYAGKAFRFQPGGGDHLHPSEFDQVGIELFGGQDAQSADAEVLHLTLAAMRAAGLETFRVTIGDLGLFHALLASLPMPERWRRRLERQFWRPRAFRNLIEELTGARPRPRTSISPLIDRLIEEKASDINAFVAHELEAEGLEPVAGRYHRRHRRTPRRKGRRPPAKHRSARKKAAPSTTTSPSAAPPMTRPPHCPLSLARWVAILPRPLKSTAAATAS